ncbi:MAG: hypothetical protein KAS63_10840 [Candidatus Heimdallarchaeota archaeon]|nr:hypothetical protein [Candidatus Heimdallarchaeota archaeon]MCK4955852.1 hypothetical protein [Candidatus Heimdallarchaeota archaeon]
MDRMYRSDIIIEGNSLTASALAYFLSLNNETDTITLIQKKKEEFNIPNSIPGIIAPVFQLTKTQMEKTFEKTIGEVKDIHSISGNFELSSNPLVILYKGIDTIKTMQEHRAKLEDSAIKHRHLSLDDIRNYYPFINTTEEIFLTEIYNSFSCSDVDNLVFTFQKLAKENNIEIINEKDKISLNQDLKGLKTENREYEATKITIVTSTDLIPNLNTEQKSILKVITPILEKFPRISLLDINTRTSMWLEEAGYFHIHRFFTDEKERECIEAIREDFQRLFTHLETLQIADSFLTPMKTNQVLESSTGWINDLKTFYISLPLQYEFTLAPALTQAISNVIKSKKHLLNKMTINELIDEI